MPSTSQESGKEAEEETVVAYVECMSVGVMNHRNAREFDAILSAPFWAPRFSVCLYYQGTKGKSVDLATHVAQYKNLVQQYPDRHIRIIDTSTTVDYKNSTAQVMMNLELTGHPPGIVQRGIGIYEWQQIRGQWLCAQMIGMRSLPGIDGGGSDDC